jgi:3-oxoacyl-[acyl-carrier protein] reductase
MKTLVITGGSDGVGKTIAARLASNNNVIILSPNEEKLKAAAEELECKYKVCDVRDYTQCEATIQEIGQVDCLINNAGLWIQGELDQDDPARIQEVVAVNLLGVINMTKAVVPDMKQQKSGLIININSQAGFYAKAERAVYNATKWGVTGFTKSMQPELAKYGIGVTGLYPGMMKTEMFSKMGIEKDMSKGLDTEDVAKTIEFILSFDKPTLFPEIGIKHIEN